MPLSQGHSSRIRWHGNQGRKKVVGQQTNNDLSRDIGRIEGEFVGMKGDIADIKKLVERIDERLAKIEARESQLRGAWWFWLPLRRWAAVS